MFSPMEGKVGTMEFSNKALEIKNMSVIMGGKAILHSISFDVRYGEILSLLGPNGSGKSTLIGAAAGIGIKTSGEVLLEGIDIGKISKKELAQKIAVVPQQNYFHMPFKVIEVVLMGRYSYAGKFSSLKAQDYDIARKSLEAVDLSGFDDRLVTELSGGEAQRVAIARALAQEAKILLMDEPTSALDPKHALSLFKLITNLKGKGYAILLAMHDVNSALLWSSRIMFLKKGETFCIKRPEEVDEGVLEGVFGVKWVKHTLPSVGEVAFPADECGER